MSQLPPSLLAILAQVPQPTPRPAPAPTPTQEPLLFRAAKKQWPILDDPDVVYMMTPREDDPSFLETWPPGETGTPQSPRPQDIPQDKYGVEVYKSSTRPIDILGDVVSHKLVHTDPTIKAYYDQFVGSLTPDQKDRLHKQYLYAQKHDGETRSEQDWAQHSGIPAYFRGYAFGQWPDAPGLYTWQQRKHFDAMMKYLAAPRPKATPNPRPEDR